jgi:hypothetical protein
MQSLHTINEPWTHYVVDDFLDIDILTELKSIEHKTPQICSGKRIGAQDSRLFITSKNKQNYPELEKLYDSLKCGATRSFFEQATNKNYSGNYLRMEVISDIGHFYLEPHPDLINKKLTVLVYTDSGEHYPGTTIYDTEGVNISHNVEAIDNRCIFFNPAADTMHGYEPYYFATVRRCLMINYFDYGDETEKI